jgi:ABC-type transport system involved in multi-copper enzyme maturation permease subunit
MNVNLEDHAVPVPAPVPTVVRSGAWHVTWHGVRTVARLELRQRVRSTRWIVALVVWFVVVGGITLLATGAMSGLMGGGTSTGRGPVLFSVVSFLVLGLGLLVTPTLTSTSINGDRNAGTLATLQVTLLSPAEIVLGKVAAAWLAACAFLLASVPFFLVALGLGGTPVRAAGAVLVLIAVLLAALCGIGVGLSSLTARTAGSTVLTFVVVAGLSVFTPILFGLTYPSISSQETVQVWTQTPSNGTDQWTCDWQTQTRSVAHTERTWWLLAANPFVVVADGSTVPGADGRSPTTSPFAGLRQVVREARQGAARPIEECWLPTGAQVAPLMLPAPSTAPIWPWGLGFTVLLGVAGAATAVRRLTIPQRGLARGTRVA